MPPISILDTLIDEAVTLRPSRILYIVPQSGWARVTQVLDLTSQLHDALRDELTPELKAAARGLASSSSSTSPPPPPPMLTLTRTHRYSSSRLTITSASGDQVADFHSPIKSYGVSRITFPADSPHCSHALEVKPLKVGRRAQSFVNHSATYAWETGGRFKAGRLSLYKAIGPGKKIEVARYESDSGGFTVGGVLVLESREVDEVVAVVTCMAVLNQRDAFYMPGLDLGKSSSRKKM